MEGRRRGRTIALAACAGRALLERNPELLLRSVSGVAAPQGWRVWRDFFATQARIRLEP